MIVRRQFLAAGAAFGLGALPLSPVFAQHEGARKGPQTGRKARTTRLFKAPDFCPNALAATPEGLWIGQQTSEAVTAAHPDGALPAENVWLVDWNGKLLKTLTHEACNTSGLAVGGGHVFALGNDARHEGAYQIGMNNKLVSRRPMPLGGGGSHGGQWHDGKLWLVVNRMNAMVRVDPATFQAEYGILIYSQTPDTQRWHDMTIGADGTIWLVTGNDSKGPASGRPGLARYEMSTGRLLELITFETADCDPHGLVFHDGKLISCDAGYHPGWAPHASPAAGMIFSIDIV